MIPGRCDKFTNFDKMMESLDQIYHDFKEQVMSRIRFKSQFDESDICGSADNFCEAELFGFYKWSKILFDAYGEPTCINMKLILRKSSPKYLLIGTE